MTGVKSDQKSSKRRADGRGKVDQIDSALSSAEFAVLSVFRDYLMTPGKMLCFGRSDLEAFRTPLARLSDRGFLIVETFHGGYSLTDLGYAAMKNAGSRQS